MSLSSPWLIPQDEIARNTLLIAILGRFLDSRRHIDQDSFLEDRSGRKDDFFRACRMPTHIRAELFKLAVKMIEELEEEVMIQLDNLVPDYRECKLHPHHRLIVGLCIRRLSLHYRSIVLRYKHSEGSKSPPSSSDCL